MKKYSNVLTHLTLMALLIFSLTTCSGSSSSDDNLTILGSSSASDSPSSLTLKADAVPDGSPTSFLINVYALYVSPNTDCTEATLVVDYGSTPSSFDMSQDPTLFAGFVDDGEYPCVVLKMRDVFSFVPDTEAVAAFPDDCVEDKNYVQDIYREDSGDQDTWKDTDGNSITGHGTSDEPVADTVFIFATTDPDAAVAGGLALSSNQIGTLESPLVVPGTSTFYADSSDSILGSNGQCSLERVTMGFR